MFREKIPSRQLTAWLFAGLTPVLIQYLSGTSCLWVLLTGVGSLVVLGLTSAPVKEQSSRWLSAGQYLIIIVVLGSLIGDAAQSWPVGNSYPAVPLILLALAAWTAQKGVCAAARVGCVLFWSVLITYLVVFGAGVREMQHPWLTAPVGVPDWTGVLLLLTPVTAGILRKDQRCGIRAALPVLFAVAASVITFGVLSSKVAAATDHAFYELSRSLNLLGAARRFEALVSAAMTVGWYALMSLYLCVAGQLCENIIPGWGKAGAMAAAVLAASWMLCDLHIPSVILAILVAVFWVALPILAQGIGKIKKS